jgi:hypothetical protein
MNDEELITAVREQRTKVHSATSVEQIISRGRALRARRRLIPDAAGALAVVAGAAVAVTALLPASHQATTQPAAWTVAKLTDGNISVHIRYYQLAVPAGLQRALRAAGVPATVTFLDHLNPACRPYPASQAQLHMVYLPRPGPEGIVSQAPGSIAFVIDPSALPTGTGVQIAWPHVQSRNVVVRPGERLPPFVPAAGPLLDLVYAGPACTGS